VEEALYLLQGELVQDGMVKATAVARFMEDPA
jgi:hypothetical protein